MPISLVKQPSRSKYNRKLGASFKRDSIMHNINDSMRSLKRSRTFTKEDELLPNINHLTEEAVVKKNYSKDDMSISSHKVSEKHSKSKG